MKYFTRNYEQFLVEWKESRNRNPLIIDGARQVGKSTLVKHFGQKHYRKTLELNFMKDGPKLGQLFADGSSPKNILDNAEVITGQTFNVKTDLLVFEEVGYSEQALNALKFFNEDSPHIHIIATGSNIGLLKRYPVGQTQQITVYPFTFREFLMATGNTMLAKYVDEPEPTKHPSAAHFRLMEELINFWFVGGMPASIMEWVDNANTGVINRAKSVRRVKARLLANYRQDFGKLADGQATTALSVERVYNAVANRIAESEDGNIPKFKFKGVLSSGNVGYERLVNPIDFLIKLKLIHKVFLFDAVNQSFGLAIQKKENLFKLAPHDVGLLCEMADVSYADLKLGKDAYKGFIAEIYVLNEFISTMVLPEETDIFTYKNGNSAEIEFIMKSNSKGVIPVEVKSGTVTKSRSLTAYVDKYKPNIALKFSAKKVANDPQRIVQHFPLYIARAIYIKYFRDGEDILHEAQ